MFEIDDRVIAVFRWRLVEASFVGVFVMCNELDGIDCVFGEKMAFDRCNSDAHASCESICYNF